MEGLQGRVQNISALKLLLLHAAALSLKPGLRAPLPRAVYNTQTRSNYNAYA